MIEGDTSLGGPKGRFPDTSWGLVSRLRKPGDENYRAAMETLCRRYWKPMYQYVRIAWRRTNEDAKDLTQAFVAWLMESEVLRKYETELGSFRRFVKVLLGRFLKDQMEARHALKRGGGVRVMPLDDWKGEIADPNAMDPEEAFDRAWAAVVARSAVERVLERFRESGNEIRARVYEGYELLAETERPTYADLGNQLGIKESDVRNHLHAARQEIAAEIRVELSGTVVDARELEEEWRALFGG